MNVNKHGLKMTGIKAAAGNTRQIVPHCGMYYELFYDMDDGRVWTVLQISLGQNSWTEYHDNTILKVGNLSRVTTMQEIADKVSYAVQEHYEWLLEKEKMRIADENARIEYEKYGKF